MNPSKGAREWADSSVVAVATACIRTATATWTGSCGVYRGICAPPFRHAHDGERVAGAGRVHPRDRVGHLEGDPDDRPERHHILLRQGEHHRAVGVVQRRFREDFVGDVLSDAYETLGVV